MLHFNLHFTRAAPRLCVAWLSANLFTVSLGACSSAPPTSADDQIKPEDDADASSGDDDDNNDDDNDDADDDDGNDDDDDNDDNATGDPDEHSTDPGCHGIDFLVVVDNSGSMADEQANLAKSFPKFLTTLQNALDETAKNFNVMVIDTDADPICGALCASLPTGSCLTPAGTLECSSVDLKCEFEMGTGRVRSGNGQLCGISGAQRYIESSNQDNLAEAFSCLGQQGTFGDGAEKPMEAMQIALSDKMLSKDGCNAGFLRSDAITVIMVITDEEDDHPTDTEENPDGSAGEPEDWFKAIMTIRPDAEKSIMAVGLIGDTNQPNAECKPFDESMLEGAEDSPRLRSFFEMFGDMGAVGSVCADDYSPFLEKLISQINESCEDFDPPE